MNLYFTKTKTDRLLDCLMLLISCHSLGSFLCYPEQKNIQNVSYARCNSFLPLSFLRGEKPVWMHFASSLCFPLLLQLLTADCSLPSHLVWNFHFETEQNVHLRKLFSTLDQIELHMRFLSCALNLLCF